MKIAVSCGDLNGIGLEIFFKGLISLKSKKYQNIEFNLYCSKALIKEYLTGSVEIKGMIAPELIKNSFLINNQKVNLKEVNSKTKINFGNISKSSGIYALTSIAIAANSVLLGLNDALVTLPLSKEAIYLAGAQFPGQTELLAEISKIDNPLMILFSKKIRVALATIHIPINKVSKNLSKPTLYRTIKIFDSSLKKDFGIDLPKIAVLGLNPHAGENGSIGNEEKKVINPVIKKLKSKNFNVSVPFPADGFFAHKEYLNFDGIMAMYHDQGLIPLKILGDGGGVNFTAGLPIIRTSPDHGTAFAIAGKGMANPKSFIDSINAAIDIYENRKKFEIRSVSKA